MINMLVTYTAKDSETRQAFYDEVVAAGCAEATRAEEGNFRYEFFFSAEKDNVVLLVEKWADEAVLKNHYDQPHLKKLVEIKEKHGVVTSIEKIVED